MLSHNLASACNGQSGRWHPLFLIHLTSNHCHHQHHRQVSHTSVRLPPAMMPRNSIMSKLLSVLHKSNPAPCQLLFSPSTLLFFAAGSPAFDLNVSGMKNHLCESAVLLLCMIKRIDCNPHVKYCSHKLQPSGLGRWPLLWAGVSWFNETVLVWFHSSHKSQSQTHTHTHTHRSSPLLYWQQLVGCVSPAVNFFFFHQSVHNMTAFKV